MITSPKIGQQVHEDEQQESPSNKDLVILRNNDAIAAAEDWFANGTTGWLHQDADEHALRLARIKAGDSAEILWVFALGWAKYKAERGIR
jgi:hypothetical protein